MRTLTYTTLFPNAVQPNHGVFVENRLRHLLGSGEVTTRVLAPVPWFPFTDRRFGSYAQYAAVPPHETRHGVDIDHPRYLVIPKIGMLAGPELLFRATIGKVQSVVRQAPIDLIDAHYFYPDGAAAVRIGAAIGKPVVVTARGTDINLYGDFPRVRKTILWTARHAAAVITVCQALKDRLVELGAEAGRIHVLRNGVDLQLFSPRDRAASRAGAGVDGFTILSVGHLIERKGHRYVIEAMPALPDATLLIAGTGPEHASLVALAERLGVAGRVRFLGQVPHRALPDLYSAADVLTLASDREGWPNVLLEAMACGTPVLATAIWGTPEVVAAPEAGRLVADRTGAAFADGVRALRADLPDRAATRRYAERFSWDATTQGQLDLFRGVIGSHRQ